MRFAMSERVKPVVTLTDQMRSEAEELGSATYRRWRSRQGYYTNSLSSHVKGKRGEIGVESWAAIEGVHKTSLFRDSTKEGDADLVFSGLMKADVKTWSNEHWKNLGRCVAVKQLDALVRKARCIVWCTHREIGSSVQITLQGWSWVMDVFGASRRTTGSSSMRQIENYQLEETDIRPMTELLLILRSSSAPGIRQAPPRLPRLSRLKKFGALSSGPLISM